MTHHTQHRIMIGLRSGSADDEDDNDNKHNDI